MPDPVDMKHSELIEKVRHARNRQIMLGIVSFILIAVTVTIWLAHHNHLRCAVVGDKIVVTKP